VLFASLNAGYNAGLCIPALHRVLEGLSAARKIEEYLGKDHKDSNDIVDTSDQSETDMSEFEVEAGVLEFKCLNFRYTGSVNMILNAVSFVVHAKETMAICGPSGSGKSTLLHLLMKLYPIPGSSILVDGMDLSVISVSLSIPRSSTRSASHSFHSFI
jgi:ABC-type multidrug transport system fused ATPase/permease subunit